MTLSTSPECAPARAAFLAIGWSVSGSFEAFAARQSKVGFGEFLSNDNSQLP